MFDIVRWSMMAMLESERADVPDPLPLIEFVA
jgi:hypothetical protein